MATFDEQIQDLVGTFTDQSAMDDWMTHGAREIINILPRKLKEKCMTETTLTNSSQTLDLDAVAEILHVTRLSADSGGKRYPCREIPSMYGDLSGLSSDMMYYGTVTDPVYWVSSSNDAAMITVYPTPTDNQTAIVYHVAVPSINASDVSTIANFPDEAEHLVVLFAAIKAAQSLLASEEDDDLYVPIINTLKTDYANGLNLLGVRAQAPQQGASQARQRKQLEALAEQINAAQQ